MGIDWISISPQNGAAGQNPVAFQLVAENETFEDKQLTVRAVCGDKYKDLTLVLKGKTYPIGTVWNFDYTGDVQQITLPKGKYKLQCWGAQGGSVTGTYAIAGSKGGYSEGVLTLTEPTTLYVFVGGKGTDYTSSASQTSTSVVNGGWNGGGAGVRTSRYNSGDTDGRSFPRGGGGATDISTVTSAMSYSSGRTTRDSASLLARCIVAGGGAGASARYTSTTTTNTSTETIATKSMIYSSTTGSTLLFFANVYASSGLTEGATFSVSSSPSAASWGLVAYDSSGTIIKRSSTSSIIVPSGCYRIGCNAYISSSSATSSTSVTLTAKQSSSTTSTSTSSSKSSAAQQGGGTSGKGQYPGTQSSAGNGGAFGLGASQSSTNYRYCGGGGGGGWYGGGTNKSDSSTSYVNYSGGGSGFVNIAANAASRPSGYTGLQLDSGTTTDGNNYFESVSGGSEKGHGGDGHARITVIG